MLVVPSNSLQEILDSTEPRFIDGKRWDVNFYFDKYGASTFMPTGGGPFDFTEFRHPSH
jgi:hypothetical protein